MRVRLAIASGILLLGVLAAAGFASAGTSDDSVPCPKQFSMPDGAMCVFHQDGTEGSYEPISAQPPKDPCTIDVADSVLSESCIVTETIEGSSVTGDSSIVEFQTKDGQTVKYLVLPSGYAYGPFSAETKS